MDHQSLDWLGRSLYGKHFYMDIEFLNESINTSRDIWAKNHNEKSDKIMVKEQDVRDIGIGALNNLSFTYGFLPEDTLGEYNFSQKKITIAPELTDHELTITLLHELIHAFEDSFEEYERYKQILLLRYFEELRDHMGKKIWDWIIYDNRSENTVYHSPFFALKSMLLDRELGLEYGTIYAYERSIE